MTLERGAFLHNRYRILEILGQGGMGSLYRAIDENLGVEVAVKENLFTTEEYARQFKREAIILANLRHPNLPRVSDHFVIAGQGQYLVMDYIEGEDLRERMDRSGVVPEHEILVIGAALCDALTYMHTRKPAVLHRDIKPGNVKINPQGEIFLVDFGLAKVVQPGQQTSTGARAMTPGYSPPEQYGAARTDHRSDIYSLGATMYAALVGVIPEDSLARTMEQTELTPVRKRNPKISHSTAAAIEKALEVHPDDRFQTAEEFKQALFLDRNPTLHALVETGIIPPQGEVDLSTVPPNEITEPTKIHEPARRVDSRPLPLPTSTALETGDKKPPPPRKKRKGRGCIWLVSIFVILSLLLGLIFSYNPAFPIPIFDQASAQITQLLTRVGIPMDFLSAFTAATVEETPRPDALDLTPSGTYEPTATWEPTMTPTQAQLETVTRTPQPTATISPSETPIPSETTIPTATPLGGGYGQVAFASNRSGKPQIWLVNVDGSGLTQITDVPWGACQPDWSPDGSRLVYISPCEHNRETYRGSGLFLINADGSDPASLPVQGLGDYDPAWSPDGKKIAFTSIRTNGRPRIMVFNLETGEAVSLSQNNNYDVQPTWSSDGSRIVFISTRNGPYQIWTMAADGSDQARFSVSKDLKNSHPVLSPDGRLLVFTQSVGEGSITHLRAIPFPDGAAEEYDVYPFSGTIPMRDADFSVDSFWLAFESWPNGIMHDIYIMAPNGAGFTQVTIDPSWDFDPSWRPFALP